MYSPNQSRKSYSLHRAIIQSGSQVTGITQVKIPDLLGDEVIDVHWTGLEKVGGLFQIPNVGDVSLVAVSNDGTQVLWVLSADHSAIWNAVESSQLDIGALQSSLTIVSDGVVANTASIATLTSALSTLDGQVVKTVTGTANEISASRTGASVGLSLPTNVVKSGAGYLRVTNTGVSSTAASVSRIEMGVASPSAPRIVLEDSSSATVWNIDNFAGAFRMFNAGNVRFNMNAAGDLSSLNSVVAATSVTAATLASTVATGTSPLTVTSTTQVNNLNAQFLNGSVRPATLNTTSFTARTTSAAALTASMASLSLPAMTNAGKWFFMTKVVLTKTVTTDVFTAGLSTDSGTTFLAFGRVYATAAADWHLNFSGSMAAAAATAYTVNLYMSRTSGTGTATSGNGDGRFHAIDAWYISD